MFQKSWARINKKKKTNLTKKNLVYKYSKELTIIILSSFFLKVVVPHAELLQARLVQLWYQI